MHERLESAKAVLFDLDGTLIKESTAIPGATKLVRHLHEQGKRIIYLTNNSSRTKEMVAALLLDLGFPASPDMVLTSSIAAVSKLKERVKLGAKVYVIGEAGLYKPLEDAGFVIASVNEDLVEAVVVGLDRSVTYQKFRQAVQSVFRGAYFLATNADRVFPIEDGFAPGAGSLVALVEVATGVHADYAGKPNSSFVFEAMKMAEAEAKNTVLIGDNPETDVLAAKNSGVFSILVKTGVQVKENFSPDLIVESVIDLLF